MLYSLKLADVDGLLCVQWSDTNSDRPEMMVNYYPTACRVRDWLEIYPGSIGHSVTASQFGGEYVYRSQSMNGHTRRVQLVDGGRTLPIKFETVPIPQPKCRLPVEWRNGEWWKRTKRGTVRV